MRDQCEFCGTNKKRQPTRPCLQPHQRWVLCGLHTRGTTICDVRVLEVVREFAFYFRPLTSIRPVKEFKLSNIVKGRKDMMLANALSIFFSSLNTGQVRWDRGNGTAFWYVVQHNQLVGLSNNHCTISTLDPVGKLSTLHTYIHTHTNRKTQFHLVELIDEHVSQGKNRKQFPVVSWNSNEDYYLVMWEHDYYGKSKRLTTTTPNISNSPQQQHTTHTTQEMDPIGMCWPRWLLVMANLWTHLSLLAAALLARELYMLASLLRITILVSESQRLLTKDNLCINQQVCWFVVHQWLFMRPVITRTTVLLLCVWTRPPLCCQ